MTLRNQAPLVALLAVLPMFSGLAHAQEMAAPAPPIHRIFVIANGTFSVPSAGHQLTSEVRLPDSSPLATSYTAASFGYRVPTFMGGDIGWGVLATRFMGFGIALSHQWSQGNPSMSLRLKSTGAIVLDDAGSTPLRRSETTVHFQFVVKPKTPDNMQVLLYGGPTWFTINQAVISTVYLMQGGTGYTVDAYDTYESTAKTWGYNFGADMATFIHPNAGIGVTMRYARATVTMPDSAKALVGIAGTQRITGGGFLIGVGLRLRY